MPNCEIQIGSVKEAAKKIVLRQIKQTLEQKYWERADARISFISQGGQLSAR